MKNTTRTKKTDEEEEEEEEDRGRSRSCWLQQTPHEHLYTTKYMKREGTATIIGAKTIIHPAGCPSQNPRRM